MINSLKGFKMGFKNCIFVYVEIRCFYSVFFYG